MKCSARETCLWPCWLFSLLFHTCYCVYMLQINTFIFGQVKEIHFSYWSGRAPGISWRKPVSVWVLGLPDFWEKFICITWIFWRDIQHTSSSLEHALPTMDSMKIVLDSRFCIAYLNLVSNKQYSFSYTMYWEPCDPDTLKKTFLPVDENMNKS